MASAPPLETSGLMGDLQPPSYEEAMGSTSPQYPPDPVNPPTAVRKPAQAPYPVQTYPVQTYPVQTYPLPPPSTPVVSVQTVYVQHGVAYGDRPVQVTCPVCSQMVVTHLEYNAGTMTWLTCAGLFIFGCVYGCCLIPFCVHDLQDVTHRCPNCSSVLGVYKRL